MSSLRPRGWATLASVPHLIRASTRGTTTRSTHLVLPASGVLVGD